MKQENISKSWLTTSKIYHTCVEELGYSRQSIKIYLEDGSISKDEYIIKRQAIDDLYLQKVLELPSEDLDLILITHDNGINRTQRALDAIRLELLARSMVENEKK